MAVSCDIKTAPQSAWLDRVAIGLAGVCAIHCLLTPVLVVMLPIIATSFFVHEDFHWWMLFLVIPTTTAAIFMGCRKHKDRWVAALSAVGLLTLILTTVVSHGNPFDSTSSGAHVHGSAEESHVCEHCAGTAEDSSPLKAESLFTTLGGLFLAGAHVRNFRLCRKADCDHGH